MKFTLSWLKFFLDTEASLEKITHTLTMIGLEVEDVINRSDELASFEVAEIVETSPHPDADKLKLCKVKTSTDLLQIVCGADNARPGIKVVLAKIGTIIPNGNFKIKKSKIRGVESNGMLCSVGELNIKGDDFGIIEMPNHAKIGDKIDKYFGLDDPVIHINVTPNRADSLGVYGIARDLAAAGIGQIKPLEEDVAKGSFITSIEAKINNFDACPLFTLCELNNIQNYQSPKWLQDLLENIGVASVSLIVDVTNYISYSFGQPMHAYDVDKLDGNLSVEVLNSAAKFQALDEREYLLTKNDLVIKDSKNIHCLAGIIGGKDSACSADTNRVILEAACFDSKYVAKSGRRLMIETDSRYRFERNVDLEFTYLALNYAIKMILSICNKQVTDNKVSFSNIKIFGEGKLPTRKIAFPVDFFESKAGFKLRTDEIIKILNKLGFVCKKKENSLDITIPSWRYDVEIKEDIIEEIVRIYGYDNIPLIPLPNIGADRIISREQRRVMDLKRLMAVNGYDEIVSWSFMDSKIATYFTEIKEEFFLTNPISTDLDYMRPSILPNLLKIAYNNLNRSYKDLSFFEIGPVFHDANSLGQLVSLAAIRIGLNLPKNHHFQTNYVDIFDIKLDIATIFASFGLSLDQCQLKKNAPEYYHPGRSSSIMLGKNILGYFGQIHPKITQILEIDADIISFELDLSAIPMSKEKFGKKAEYKLSNYQMINRDYAFVIDNAKEIGEILRFIQNIDKNLIKKVNLFDIYTGNKIESGKKSIAISVTIQSDNKTLTEEDINLIHNAIIAGVAEKFNAVLRI